MGKVAEMGWKRCCNCSSLMQHNNTRGPVHGRGTGGIAIGRSQFKENLVSSSETSGLGLYEAQGKVCHLTLMGASPYRTGWGRPQLRPVCEPISRGTGQGSVYHTEPTDTTSRALRKRELFIV